GVARQTLVRHDLHLVVLGVVEAAASPAAVGVADGPGPVPAPDRAYVELGVHPEVVRAPVAHLDGVMGRRDGDRAVEDGQAGDDVAAGFVRRRWRSGTWYRDRQRRDGGPAADEPPAGGFLVSFAASPLSIGGRDD